MSTAFMSASSIRRRSGSDDLSVLAELSLRGGEKVGRLRCLDNLDTIPALKALDVSSNALTTLAPLGVDSAPALTSLDASGNRLVSLEGLQPLAATLKSLVLTGNSIERLPRWLGTLHKLERLGLAHNRLSELRELQVLAPIVQLAALEIASNPLAKLPHSRLYAIHSCRALQRIDASPVGLDEVGEAAARFERPAHDELSERLTAVDAANKDALKRCDAATAAADAADASARSEACARVAAEAKAAQLLELLEAERSRASAAEAALRMCRARLDRERHAVYRQLLAAAEGGEGEGEGEGEGREGDGGSGPRSATFDGASPVCVGMSFSTALHQSASPMARAAPPKLAARREGGKAGDGEDGKKAEQAPDDDDDEEDGEEEGDLHTGSGGEGRRARAAAAAAARREEGRPAASHRVTRSHPASHCPRSRPIRDASSASPAE